MDPNETASLVPAANEARPLIAHRLDGRFAPMRPEEIKGLIRDLAARLDVEHVDYVLGFPEGGVVPAFAFAEFVARPLVVSTRFQLTLPRSIAFASSRGTMHYIHGLEQGDRVVIVEDEVTTGVTVVNAARALRRAGVQVADVATLLAVDDARMWRSMDEEKLSLHVGARLPAEFASRRRVEEPR